MKVYLKNIDINKILNSKNLHYENKEIIEKSIKLLIKEKLNYNTNNMALYKGNKKIMWFSRYNDFLEMKEIFENEKNKIQYIIDWYFMGEINNNCWCILNGYI